MKQSIKICGLSTPDTLAAALEAGADLVGFVRFAGSPRHISIEQGTQLAARTRGKAKSVVLTVDADDAEFDEIVTKIAPDMLQLHGSESPQHVAEIATRYALPVIKAIGIGRANDLDEIKRYRDAADIVLLDAKPASSTALPGGNGIPFDWTFLKNLDAGIPFMLSGGLTPGNVAEAIQITGVSAVDISSGVEKAKGIKDAGKIRAFIHNAREAWKKAA